MPTPRPLPALLLAAVTLAPTVCAVEPLLEDVAIAVGLDCTHRNGMTGKLWFVEMMGSGVALFDADNDGDLDVFCVQGGALAGARRGPGDRLYRNELAGATLSFRDVTESARIEENGYGMGVATGDVDNDGWTDLYVTNWGPNALWRNAGDGTFSESAAAAGVDDPSWGTSATFTDLDGDGWLDLYVANYVRYRLAEDPGCKAPSTAPDYCGPLAFPAAADRLYRNRGDGTFEDWSERLRTTAAPGLGVVAADFDGNGKIDLYVANDQTVNHLWLQGPEGFAESALLAGAAVGASGRSEASMGALAADLDDDGDLDLFLTHLAQETNTFYRNRGDGGFDDRSAASGAGRPSWSHTGFGVAAVDLDGDNVLDLYVTNGDVRRIPAQVAAGDPLPLRQPDQMLRGLGDGRFEAWSAPGLAAVAASTVGRGVAAGDIDNDGDTDLLVSENNGPLRLLRNDAALPGEWLGLLPVAHGAPALGTIVTVRMRSGRALTRRVASDGSYLSAGDPRVLVRIPPGDAIERIELQPSGGEARRIEVPKPGRYHRVEVGGSP